MTDARDEDEEELTTVGMRADVVAATKKAKSQRPWLVIVSGSGGIGKTYRIANRIVLGRSPQCDVQIEDGGASRQHAALEQGPDGAVRIVDLGSRNGTFVNGEQVSREVLKDGDKIQIGDTTILKLSYQDELDEQLQRNLYESATRDALTRVVNKRGFEEALSKEFAFARRHKRALSLLTFDVDHFKRVNDTYGHPAGDYVLRKMAEVANATLRREDLLARIGGEEFAVLLRDIEEEPARACAERVRTKVETCPFETGGMRIPVTISIGVATLSSHADAGALVAAADRALYEAKRAGRNRVVVAGAPEPT